MFDLDEPIDIVNGDINSLIDVIEVGGEITINLAENGEYIFTEGIFGLYAPTALPDINSGSTVTINGNGATIRAAVSGFRIFSIEGGTLTLNDLTIRDATIDTNGGAAISNGGGFLTLNNVQLENNRVEVDLGYGRGTGGAVYTYFGYTTISNSVFTNNYAVKYGGALYNWDGEITITGTSFINNSAGLYGGAIGSRDESSGGRIIGVGNSYTGNSAGIGGGAIYIESGGLDESSALIDGNIAPSGGALFTGPSGDPAGVSGLAASITSSNITNNSSPAVESTFGSSGLVDVTGNWWGSASGVQPEDIVGDGIDANNPLTQPLRLCGVTSDDNDGDCLPDEFEWRIPGLLADLKDSDGNGVLDGNEDYDGDGLNNFDEYLNDTSPTDEDSDYDGIIDGIEIHLLGTDPNAVDTDGDSLLDGEEYFYTETNPALSDTDGDGISDADEDTDGDGISNWWELQLGLTPTVVDSDSNGVDDGDEDYDGDGLINRHELELLAFDAPYSVFIYDSDYDGVNDGNEDLDSDGLVNRYEFSLQDGSENPIYQFNVADSDGDSIPDGDEDLDNDGLTNADEHGINRIIGWDVYDLASADSDGDGVLDSLEDYDSDGLNDLLEVSLRLPNGVLAYHLVFADSDGNGIDDGNEDFDADGLPNLVELNLTDSGQSVYDLTILDTDGDGISDGGEDLDSDGLTNAQEAVLNRFAGASVYALDRADSNDNGIFDSDEDLDGDRLINRQELRFIGNGVLAYNPASLDSDGDGISDGDEDFDGDGLTNYFELTFAVFDGLPYYDPLAADTNGDGTVDGADDLDSDGLTNVQEIYINASAGSVVYDLVSADTDSNGIIDGHEDLDADGLTNVQEFRFVDGASFLYNPAMADTDSNDTFDGDEDFDGDGLSNVLELTILDDFSQPFYDPIIADTNGDGTHDGDEDFDADGLTNVQEIRINSIVGEAIYDLTVADSNADGMFDGQEDYDTDGLSNAQEFRFEVGVSLTYDPTIADTDGNGTSDGDEDFDDDGLLNHIELSLTDEAGLLYYDPVLADTDNNGIVDADEDLDDDELTNIQELQADVVAGGGHYNLALPDSDGNGVLDSDEDADSDGLTNRQELSLFSPDGELAYIFIVADSDENGVLDGDEDPDGDRLSNTREFAHETDPFNADNDGDRLSDGFEIDWSLTTPTIADSDGNGVSDDLEDPDDDTLNNYQEYRLGTDPREATTLGAPSRLHSETVMMPSTAIADGNDNISILVVARDAQGRFLPNQPVTWTTTNSNLVVTSLDAATDEEGTARASVTSAMVTYGVVEVRAADIVLGRPVVRFTGGDPAVRLVTSSAPQVLAGQMVTAIFEVTNDGALPIAGIELAANVALGIGSIDDASALEPDATLHSQGTNSVIWGIALLNAGESRHFSIRLRVGSTQPLHAQIPLNVQVTAVEDTNAANNSATLVAQVASELGFSSVDEQAEKLAVSFLSDPAEASVGQTVDLVVLVENLSDEPLFNVSAAAPFLGIVYPNVVFAWADPARPGYLAPAGSGNSAQAIARIPFTIPPGYPSGFQRSVTVQAIDGDPADSSRITTRDTLTDSELAIRGPNLTAQLTANPAVAVPGEIVTFTLTVANSSASTDAAADLHIAGSLLASGQSLGTLAPGDSTTIQFTHTVTAADAPQLTAQLLLTGHGLTAPDVLVNQTVRRTVRVNKTVAPTDANLLFPSLPAPAFLPGRSTSLPLTIRNAGGQSADQVQLRLVVPFGIEVDPASLADGTYDANARQVVWDFGTVPANESRSVSPAFVTDAGLVPGTVLIFDILLATESGETNNEDNIATIERLVELPAARTVTLNATPRTWLIADGSDVLTLNVTVLDQLGGPLPNATVALASELPGVLFGSSSLETDGNGYASTSLRASAVGAVNLTASADNGTLGSAVINGRSSAVSITRSPESIGIGGQDNFEIFIVNTATLPDGLTATGDIVDLTVALPPEISAEWFQFARAAVPLGFGDFLTTQLTVTVPPASELPNCSALVGTHAFTVTATGRTLGPVGQADGQLTITGEPPNVSGIMPDNNGRIGGDQILFGWRSNTPGDAVVYYRRQGEASFTALSLAADSVDARLYKAALEVGTDADGTVYEWYGEMTNGCGVRSIGTAVQPRLLTRVRSTTFADPGYDFLIADGYDQTVTTTGAPLVIRVRNDDTITHAVVLDVENPYPDLTLGFIESGSVDQVAMLAPGQTFSTLLRVFTQDTEREVYSLTLRLENDEGDVSRIPLILRVKQPVVALDVRILEVDPVTLVTHARLTNMGDTLTDLTLDIVQEGTGIPANMIIQPDVQHTYLQAGQSLDIAVIPLDLQDAASPENGMSMLAGEGGPSLMSVSGPYAITASARNSVIPSLELTGGNLTNTCGADGSDRTVAAPCTVPAGSATQTSSGWYCTNRPDIDVPMSLALPNGGLGLPLNSVTVSANFSPGGDVYSHSTTVSLNGSLVGSAVVPDKKRILGNLPAESLVLGGLTPTQLINLRSTHSNENHYTVASGFRITVEYDEHTSTGCFTPEDVAHFGDSLQCTGNILANIPAHSLDLSLDVNHAELNPQQLLRPYTFSVGETIPVVAEVVADGLENLGETVRVELTVPRNLRPQGMTIQGEDQDLLDRLVEILSGILDVVNPNLSALLNHILDIQIGDDHVTFAYDYDRDLVIGQPFTIHLDVTGQVEGGFQIVGRALAVTEPDTAQHSASATQSMLMFTDDGEGDEDQEESDSVEGVIGTAVCATTAKPNNIGNSHLREVPISGKNVGWVKPAEAVHVIGLYNAGTANPNDDWYLITTLGIPPMKGWSADENIVRQHCIDDLPRYDISGILLPPPPDLEAPEEGSCSAFSIYESVTTHIRDFPDTTRGNIIGYLSNDGRIPEFTTYYVTVIGRYTASTPSILWDDWYQVVYDEMPENVDHAWVNAEVSTLRPGFDTPNCSGIAQFEQNAEGELIPATTPAHLPPLPQMLPISAELYGTPHSDADLNMSITAEVALNLAAPFTMLPMYEGLYDRGQGYGLNTFAYRHPDYYEGTNQIHSGLDFGGREPDAANSVEGCAMDGKCFRVLQICDGRVVSLRPRIIAPVENTGAVLKVQCFSREGSLSNIFVTYNHLFSTADLEVNMTVKKGEDRGLHVYQYQSNSYPHLHFEVFYDHDSGRGEAIRLNPILFFSANVTSQISVSLDEYYPKDLPDGYSPDAPPMALEWAPADRDDPVHATLFPTNAPYDAINWHRATSNLAFTFTQFQLEGRSDFDLGIRFEDNSSITIIGDDQAVAGQNICKFVFGRTDRPLIFRNGGASCPVAGGLQAVPVGTDGYNGLELLENGWVMSLNAFFAITQR